MRKKLFYNIKQLISKNFILYLINSLNISTFGNIVQIGFLNIEIGSENKYQNWQLTTNTMKFLNVAEKAIVNYSN